MREEAKEEIKRAEKALASPEVSVRRSAAHVLGNAGGKKALALLEKTLADKDVFVRCAVIEALGNMSSKKALELLENALCDKHWLARVAAADTLGRVGGKNVVVLLKKLLADENADVRHTAAKALKQIDANEPGRKEETGVVPTVRISITGAKGAHNWTAIIVIRQPGMADTRITTKECNGYEEVVKCARLLLSSFGFISNNQEGGK